VDSGKAYVKPNGSWAGGCNGDAHTGGFNITSLGAQSELLPAAYTDGNGTQFTVVTSPTPPTGSSVWNFVPVALQRPWVRFSPAPPAKSTT
jgi:hypothetical protein